MRSFPIIPIWMMIVICLFLFFMILKNKNKNIRHIVIVILLFIINMRFMIPSGNSIVLANNLDVLFVIDSTISMNAEDYNGTNTRLSAVKKDCEYIIRSLNGARFSLITFSNEAKVMLPYTKDINTSIEAIDVIEPVSSLYAKGSSLNIPIDSMINSLKSSKQSQDKIRIVFYISDGEITTNEKLKSFKGIHSYVDNGAVLGYGTSKGGYMKDKSYYDEDSEYIMDYTGTNFKKAKSVIDEDNLKKIADDMNVDYIHMDNQNKISYKIREIERMADEGVESSDKSTYDDIYYIFVIPLLILLILEFNDFRRNNL